MTHRYGSVVAALLLAACDTSTRAERFVMDAAQALGGEARLRAVNAFVIEGHGAVMNLGQDMTWPASGQAFTLSEVRRAFDLTELRSRTEQTRTPNFLYFQGPQPQRQVLGFARDVAYSVAENGRVSRQTDVAAKERLAEFYHHPLSLVREMLALSTTISNLRTENGTRTADVALGNMLFVVSLDEDGRPVSVSSQGYHPNLGNVTISTAFTDYQPVEGLSLPTRLSTTTDDYPTLSLQVDRYVLNATSSAPAAPAEAASMPEPSLATPVVEATTVSPGVWLLAGQSHHSALIEFADHFVLFEAPQSEARTRAVLVKARQLVPSKPVTQVIMSHHHFDHSAGIRLAVSQGLRVITHAKSAAFVEEIARRSHSRRPDALERSPFPLAAQSVEDPLTLEDSAMRVVIYPLTGNPHADAMLTVYIPRDRVLIEADAYSPGGTYHPYASHLLETIRARNLLVDRIVPLHGSVTTLAELTNAVGAR